MDPFEILLSQSKAVLLDGATGTELSRRGFDVDRPGWSANAILEAPDLLLSIHRDYVEAGAMVITANTFRTHRRSLANTLYAGRDVELTRRAVEIAREATGDRALVAGSIPPLGDCYRPDLSPCDAEMREEHEEQVEKLASSGVDLLILETMNNQCETVIAADVAGKSGLPFVVSLIVRNANELLSGEPLGRVIDSVLAHSKPSAICINCVHPEDARLALKELGMLIPDVPLGFYGNTHHWHLGDGEVRFDDAKGLSALEYGSAMKSLFEDLGLRLVGGCCGTGPDHIHQMYKSLRNDE